MRQYLADLFYKVISSIVLCTSLTILMLFSLWHNFVTVHFHRKSDPRDQRSSKTEILPGKGSQKSKYARHFSTVSTSPLQMEEDQDQTLEIEEDCLNNIEFDHSVTENLKPLGAGTGNESSFNETPHFINNAENPFKDVIAAEDLKLMPDLKYYYKQYNITIEEHEIETDDGFIIDLWHMKSPNSNNSSQDGSNGKPPVLLLHGLLQSSGSFASSGRKSLAYYLLQSGFDVWLGNNRCGLNPKWSKSKNKKVNVSSSQREKWNWNTSHMVKFDVKALVETVLKNTGFDKLSLIGHSQGTTQGFLGLINGEELYKDDKDSFKLTEKLENFVALAPAVYPGPLMDEKIFVRLMAKGIDHPLFFGNTSFIPMMMAMRKLMVGGKLFSFLSYIMFNYLFDWNDALWDKPIRDRHFLFSPVNVSVNLMQWWLSSDPKSPSFKHGSHLVFPDDKIWFPVEDENTGLESKECHLNPEKPSASHFPRILMFIPKQDRLVDGERLINHFINKENHDIFKIWYIDEYSHLDVLWANDVISRIGVPLVESLRSSSSEKNSL